MKTHTGLKEIQNITLYKDSYDYGFDGETFQEADVLCAYMPIVEKRKRFPKSRKALKEVILTAKESLE